MDNLQQGIAALKAGQRDEARRLFALAIKANPNDERVWQWMYNASNDDKERIFCLQKLLRINPQNEKAGQLLEKLTGPSDHFTSAPSQSKKNSNTLVFSIIAIAMVIFVGVILGFSVLSKKQVTGDDVIKAFKDAGLQAENPSQMTKADFSIAPYVCKATHFFIPSIDSTAGGRIFICDNDRDRDIIATYYTELGKSSAMFFSWVFVKGNIVVQINGDLPETTARKYEAAIP